MVLLMIATIAIAIIYAYSSSWARLSSKSYMVQVKVIDASFGEEDGNKIITITVWNIGPINATIVAVLINGESVKAEPLPVSLEPGDVIEIKAYYNWEAGEGYKIEVVANSGFSYYSIFVAGASPVPLSAWAYRREVIIRERSGQDLYNYQVLVVVDTQSLIEQGKMRPDGGDIRFTDADGRLLAYWVEPGTINTTATRIWVLVPFLPANSEEIIYMYYGNPDARSLSNFGAVFPLDTFEDGAGGWSHVDWAASVGVVVEGEEIVLVSGGEDFEDRGAIAFHDGFEDRGTVVLRDSFEDGNIAGWETGPEGAGWTATDEVEAPHGSWCARSGEVSKKVQYSYIRKTVNGPATVMFWWMKDEKKGELYFLVNDTVILELKKKNRWELETYYVPEGVFVLEWRYEGKKGHGYLDDVVITNDGLSGWETGAVDWRSSPPPPPPPPPGQPPTPPTPSDQTQLVGVYWYPVNATVNDDNVAYEGNWCLRSGPVGDGQYVYLRKNITGPATIVFWWKVDSEKNKDRLVFMVDGEVVFSISGKVKEWQKEIYSLTPGDHVVEWRYIKDEHGSKGEDCGWLDNITMYNGGLEGWETGPEGAGWYITDDEDAHSGHWCIRSGLVEVGHYSYLKRTIKGPCTITFWWKIDSVKENRLEFRVDDELAYFIDGKKNWRKETYSLPAGLHVVEWRYVRMREAPREEDCGWLDDIEWGGYRASGSLVSIFTPTNSSRKLVGLVSFYWQHEQPSGTGVRYQVEWNRTGMWTLIPDDMLPGNREGFTSGPVDLTNVPPAAREGFFVRLRVRLSSFYGNATPAIHYWRLEYRYRNYVSPEPSATLGAEEAGEYTLGRAYSSPRMSGPALAVTYVGESLKYWLEVKLRRERA